jgi:serine/threonine protein kinase
VVHRDFKPANVLLGPDGARVVDAAGLERNTATLHKQKT